MPNKRSSLCTYPGCRSLTLPGEGRCGKHPYAFTPRSGWAPDSVRGNAAERGYDSKWVKKRELVLKRDNGLCQECLRHGIIRAASEVDHITPKCEGGDDRMSNLESLDSECHSRKTAREAMNKAAGKTLKFKSEKA